MSCGNMLFFTFRSFRLFFKVGGRGCKKLLSSPY
nr:MAG TPA: hypothetical protein [Caudoviricetes sp.]